MALTVTDILKFRESENDPWQRLLLQANINFNLIYPVGSIYMSTVNVNPATLFGGTWEQLEDRFLLGAGTNYTAGDTGGEAAHTLTDGELPKTSGEWWMRRMSWGTGSTQSSALFGGTSGIASSDTGSGGVDSVAYYSGVTRVPDKIKLAFGNDEAHNNMPPYIVVYMWKRLTLSPSLTPLPMNVLGDVASQDIVPVSMGGTGADNAADARTNLGVSTTTLNGVKLTGFASVDGLKDVIRQAIVALDSVGQLQATFFDTSGISPTSPFYGTYYSGYLTKLGDNRGYGLFSDAWGQLFLIVLKDGVVTITAK